MSCSHFPRFRPNHDKLEKKISNPTLWACQTCGTTDSVWICLSCGYFCCDSETKGHVKVHCKKARHYLAMQLQTRKVHCFDCDVWVDDSDSDNQDLERIRKLKITIDEADSEMILEKTIGKAEKLDVLDTVLRKWKLMNLSRAFQKWCQVTEENRSDANKKKRSLRAQTQMAVLTKKGQTGLRNLGNTCYINAVLQALSNIPCFRDFYLEKPPVIEPNEPEQQTERMGIAAMKKAQEAQKQQSRMDEDADNETQPCRLVRVSTLDAFAHVQNRDIGDFDRYLTRELCHLFRVIWSGKWAVVSPHSIVSAVWKAIPDFKGYNQQDAQEFLGLFMKRLDEENKSAAKVLSETVGNSLGVISRSSSVAVDVKPHRAVELQDMIVRNFSGKMETTVQCNTCTHTINNSDEFISLGLSINPKDRRASGGELSVMDLIQQLQNTEVIDESTGWKCEKCLRVSSCSKTSRIIGWPTVLVLHLERFSWSGNGRRKLDTTVNFPLEKFQPAAAGGVTYDLQSVIIHEGNGCSSGHYVCHTRSSLTDLWYKFNDNRVQQCTSRDVEATKPYLLFYIKNTETASAASSNGTNNAAATKKRRP